MSGAALVTGAANRIGAAIARRLAGSGYAVAVHYRGSADDAERLVAELRDGGAEAVALSADLADRGDRATLVARAVDALGPLTALINNASIFEADSVDTLADDLWDLHFAIHAEAPVFLARDFAAALPEGRHGAIVNIIDERVWRLAPAFFSYTLSKSVLWTATRTLAQSLAPRIRVNAIGPGPTLKAARQSEEEFQRSIEALPLKRRTDPEEIADGVLFLLTAPAMTGQMLALDGGEHLVWPERRGPTPREND